MPRVASIMISETYLIRTLHAIRDRFPCQCSQPQAGVSRIVVWSALRRDTWCSLVMRASLSARQRGLREP